MYGQHSRADTLHTVDAPNKKNEYEKIFPFSLRLRVIITIIKTVEDVQCACARMAAKLHIATFVTSDFDPSPVSRQITDSSLDQTK